MNLLLKYGRGDIYSAYIKVDLKKDIKEDKMIKQIINRDYGSFLTTFLNADFTTAENAYNTFLFTMD